MPTIVRSSGIDSEQALQETAINSSQPTSGTKADGQADEAEIPETVLWSVIFSLPSRLDHKAEQARSAGENDSLWTNYFVRQAKISASSANTLRQSANSYTAEVSPVSERAKVLIQNARASKSAYILPEYDWAENVMPHELGHQFGLLGDQPGSMFFIMDYPNTSSPSRVQFHPEHINIMRRRVKSPGR